MFNDKIMQYSDSFGIEADVREVDFRHSGMELAQAYVPFQTFNAANLFSPEEALLKGTIFPELYRPYEPWHASRPENMKGTWV